MRSQVAFTYGRSPKANPSPTGISLLFLPSWTGICTCEEGLLLLNYFPVPGRVFGSPDNIRGHYANKSKNVVVLLVLNTHSQKNNMSTLFSFILKGHHQGNLQISSPSQKQFY